MEALPAADDQIGAFFRERHVEAMRAVAIILAVAQLERAMIQRALAESHGHLETAADRLGISRKGLFLKRRRLGLAN